MKWFYNNTLFELNFRNWHQQVSVWRRHIYNHLPYHFIKTGNQSIHMAWQFIKFLWKSNNVNITRLHVLQKIYTPLGQIGWFIKINAIIGQMLAMGGLNSPISPGCAHGAGASAPLACSISMKAYRELTELVKGEVPLCDKFITEKRAWKVIISTKNAIAFQYIYKEIKMIWIPEIGRQFESLLDTMYRVVLLAPSIGEKGKPHMEGVAAILGAIYAWVCHCK